MPSFRLLPVLALLPAFLQAVHADVSLFIPGFDPQPLSAANLGVDASGRTTWEIVPGTLTGTFDAPSFVGTAILVEGPDDAHVTYSNPELSMSFDIHCGFNNGIASCVADQGYFTTPFVFQSLPIVPFLVQGGGPATIAASTLASSSAAAIPTSSPPALPASTPAPVSSSSSSTSPGFVTSSNPSSITPSPSAPTANPDLNSEASGASAPPPSTPNPGLKVAASISVAFLSTVGVALVLLL